MRIGSLCSGYGGLEEGVRAVLGGEVAWHSEIDPGACKILAARYPGVPNIGDMTAVDWAQVEPVDVLTGGTPCQDLSAAGKRAGMTEGTRSNLWVAMREAIATLRPSLVVWENVRGAYSARADSELESREGRLGVRGDGPVLRALGRVLGDLADLGYDARWHGLRAADVGAPHGRFRVFVVAWPAADADQSVATRLADASQRGEIARATAGRGGAVATPHSDRLGHERSRRARDRRPGSADGAVTAANASHDGCEGIARFPRDAKAVRAGTAEPRRARGDRVEWGPYGPAIARWERVLGRLAPSPTEPGKNGQPRLSPAFVEFLMGLPAGWVTDVPGITRNEALKALGNGVVWQQCAAALRIMLADTGLVAA